MKTYENADQIVSEMKGQWNRNVRSMRVWGFVAAILMIVIGVLGIFYPIQTTYAVEVAASVALLVFGCWQVVRYMQRPVFLRTGASLASGILNVILAVLLLTSPAEDMLLCFAMLFGLDLLMLGIEQLTMTGRLHAIGVAETGWLTFDGVLGVIVGVLLLLTPAASLAAVSALITVYLLYGGINLLVACVNAKELEA